MFGLVLIFISAILFLVILVYNIIKKKSNYWEKKNVPHLRPLPFFGNYKDYILLKLPIGDVLQDLCEQFPDKPYFGTYYGTEPALVIQDPNLLKLILTKDYYYFNGRDVSDYCDIEPTTKSLFFTYGDQWKILRQNLSPIFTSAKMKNMFPLIEHCAQTFEKLLEEQTYNIKVVELKRLMGAFTLDCVGFCSFGVDMGAMRNSKDNPFVRAGEKVFERTYFRGIKNIVRNIWPALFYFLNLRFFPDDLSDFFIKLLTDVFQERQYKPTNKQDFVDMILTLKNNNANITGDSIHNLVTGERKKVSMEVTKEVLIGQCLSFFGAGFETSATTLTLTVYELAKNVKAQKRAVEEVDDYLLKHDNKLYYDILTELPYLDACLDEALRLYPVLGNLTREVMRDYTFPDGLKVEKGMRIHIPLNYMQRCSIFFPEPKSFHPERFLPEERHKIMPYTYMPFGEGPRICIGLRFAKMQMLAGLITLFKNYTLETDETTPTKIMFDTRSIVNHPSCDINMKLVPRIK
ncbi:hypothetical protein K1T71_001215 [Dendrolimus kikuchii]|uniref:Uncharacterized protein n=1 Tax=Dendrolimus kikuchii TaxID=765133 RepID=A0ACC1DH03_9NEOP|nr:hypothetical protein K1T71_001215 [Dendrolimus kikuchii]